VKNLTGSLVWQTIERGEPTFFSSPYASSLIMIPVWLNQPRQRTLPEYRLLSQRDINMAFCGKNLCKSTLLPPHY